MEIRTVGFSGCAPGSTMTKGYGFISIVLSLPRFVSKPCAHRISMLCLSPLPTRVPTSDNQAYFADNRVCAGFPGNDVSLSSSYLNLSTLLIIHILMMPIIVVSYMPHPKEPPTIVRDMHCSNPYLLVVGLAVNDASFVPRRSSPIDLPLNSNPPRHCLFSYKVSKSKRMRRVNSNIAICEIVHRAICPSHPQGCVALLPSHSEDAHPCPGYIAPRTQGSSPRSDHWTSILLLREQLENLKTVLPLPGIESVRLEGFQR